MTTGESIAAAGVVLGLVNLVAMLGGGATWKLADRLARLETSQVEQERRLSRAEQELREHCKDCQC